MKKPNLFRAQHNRLGQHFKHWLGASAIALSATASLNAFAGFTVSGTQLLDDNGNAFVMRGINHAHTWYTHQTGAFEDIADTGANTIRVVLSNGEQWNRNSASDVANVISLCKANKLVCVLEVHDATGAGEAAAAGTIAGAAQYWVDIKNALVGQEDYVIINIANEPVGNGQPVSKWIDEHKAAIRTLRDAGLTHTLLIDAPNWGQDWQNTMLDHASKVADADSLGNTMFSVHMYEVYQSRSRVENYISDFLSNHNLPLIVGEFGADHQGQFVDADSILAVAEQYDIGYMGWSWSGNGSCCTALDMAINFNPGNLSSWGDRLINGVNGIKQTSELASVYGGTVVSSSSSSVSSVTPPPSSSSVPSSSSSVAVSSVSSVYSSASSQAVDTGSCAGVNVYPNWTAKDWSGGEYNHADAGDKMVYQNTLYTANWYTTSTPGSNASWTVSGTCGSTTTSSVTSSDASSVASSEPSSAPALSSSSVAVSSAVSSSSAPEVCEEMCKWYQDAPRPLCDNQTSGWGYENGQSCIGRATCENQYGDGGVISSCTTVSSSESSVVSSESSSSVSSAVSSSTSSAVSSVESSSSSSSSSTEPTPTDGVFRVDATGNITKSGEVLPIRCGSWFGLEGQHEPKDAEHNADGAPMELYMGNMWWANGGQGTGRTIQQTMDEITALGINTVRFPIAPQTLDANDPQGIGAAQNGGVLKNHSSVLQDNARQAMEDFIKLADQNGINLIIDIHSCSNYVGWRAGRLDAKPPYADAERINYDFTREGYSCSATGNPSSVTQIDAYGESQWLEDLKEIASLSEKLGVNNIMAVDIFNEPWDYTWAEWKDLAEKAYGAISAENDDILIMVEGIAGGTAAGVEVPHGDESTNPNWGENFYPAADAPLDIPKERLIISPHTYGPSVFVQKQFLDQNQAGCAGLEGDEAADAKCNIVIQPDVLEAGWEEHFGFLRDEGYAMIIGEFGGAMDWPVGAENGVNWLHVTEKVDQQWQEAFVDYMVKEDIQGCYWSINPESADTGGLYKHSYIPDVNESGWGTWEEFDTRKVNLLKRFWGM